MGKTSALQRFGPAETVNSDLKEFSRRLPMPDAGQFEFGPYRLDVLRRTLLRGESMVVLPPKSLEVLAMLVRNAGRTVTREEFMGAIWGDTVVEEGNLSQMIFVLRKALHDPSPGLAYIQTVPRRGYRFSQPVRFPVTTTHAGSVPAGSAPSFAGREAELRSLDEAFERALSGNGHVAFIAGNPGIGKTALADEFLRRARRRFPGLQACIGRCLEQFGEQEAYLPVLDAVAALLRGGMKASACAALRTHAPTWCAQFPSAFDAADTRLKLEAVGANKARMLREIGDALRALATEFPLVLLFEDLHWSDASTVDLLRYLGPMMTGQRLLILGTFRPAELELQGHPLLPCKREMATHEFCTEIVLGELDQDAVGIYLDSRFSGNEFPPGFRASMNRWTQGHPLFLVRMLDWIVDSGDIFCPPSGHWCLGRPLSEIEPGIPKEIRGMILRQLEAMYPEDARTLQVASVQGEEFLSTILAGSLRQDQAVTDSRLEKLAGICHFIVDAAPQPLPNGSTSASYRFVHALYQRAIYESIAPGRRAGLHAEVAGVISAVFESDPAPVSGRLAMHFELAGDATRAIERLLDAVEVAMRRHAVIEALALCARATVLCLALQGEARARWRARILEKQGAAHLLQYRLEEARTDFLDMLAQARNAELRDLQCSALNRLSYVAIFEHQIAEIKARATEALAIARAIGDRRQEADSLANLAVSHSVSGDLPQARGQYELAIGIAESIGHESALMVALTHLGLLHFFQSDYEKADRRLRRARVLALGQEDGFRLPLSLFFHGLTLGNLGRISEALGALSGAREIAQRNGNNLPLAQSLNGIGWIHRELQDFARALEFDRKSLEVASAHRVVEAEANAWINLIHGYIQTAEWAKAADAVRSVESLYGKDRWNRWRFFDIRLQAAKTELALSTGELVEADRSARLLLSNATRHQVPKYLALAHGLLAEVAAQGGRLAEAKVHGCAAIDALGGRSAPLVGWKLHGNLARIAQQTGDLALAASSFAQARTFIELIATNVEDASMRDGFLSAAAVRRVLEPGQ